jgi:hypothetical protein
VKSAWMLCLATVALPIAMLGGDDSREGLPAFDLSWHTLDAGGATFSTAAGFELGGTIGQSDANGTLLTGGSFTLAGGFWPSVSGEPVNTCPGDIAPIGGDGLVNIDDLLLVISSWGACAGCAADVVPIGGDGLVDIDDLLAIISAWGACP